MNKSVEKTVALLRKSYAGELTADEQLELGRLLENERMRQLYEEIGDDEYLTKEFRRYDFWKPAWGFRKFREKRRQQRRRRRIVRLSVAASILVALGGICLLVEQEKRQEMPGMAESGVESGSFRACLQLSSGERIVLDESLQKDVREMNGKVRIDSGEVVYSACQTPTLEVEDYHTLYVPQGGEYRLQLADGTRVHLNAGSELRYPVVFTAAERKVFLKGEAWFEVEKEAGRPFYVETDEVCIRVYGTAFNVNTHGLRAIEAVLVSGEIGIAKHQGAEEWRMYPGQLASYDRASGEISFREVDVRKYIAWKDGEFCFNDDSLEEILEELGRWYNVTVLFRTEEKKGIQFSGHLKRYENIRKILDSITESTGIVFQIMDHTVIVE